MQNTTVLENPALQEILRRLRDKKTVQSDFRQHLKRAGYLMTYEILEREMATREVDVETELGTAKSQTIDGKILQVAVLRAGAPFAEGGTQLLDELYVQRDIGYVDAKRIENGGLDMEIRVGSIKVPGHNDDTLVVIYDPMLATASTMIRIMQELKERGEAKQWVLCSILAAPYGIERLIDRNPDLRIYTLAIDRGGNKGLDERGYIVPGLGDCGDRAFGRC